MNTTVNRYNSTYWIREDPHLKVEVLNMQQGIMAGAELAPMDVLV